MTMQFLKTTIFGGLVFLVPVVILFLILSEAAQLMTAVAEPLAAIIPVDSIGGIATANFLAVVSILLVSFGSGLLARTRPARNFAEKLETAVLHKVPGYSMIKGFASSFAPDQNAALSPVLVRLDDRERIGLAVERVDDSRWAVYFPGAPNAWSGIVEIVSAKRVEPLEASMSDVIAHAELFGQHSSRLLSRQ